MITQKRLKSWVRKAALGLFFVVFGILMGASGPLSMWQNAYAVLGETNNSEQRTDENGNPIEDEQNGGGENGDGNAGNEENGENQENGGNNNGNEGENNEQNGNENTEGENEDQNKDATTSCQDSLGAIGWLICPTTGVIAQAVDWLYERLEGILVINPVEMKDGSPIYEVWKYCLGLTNIVFVIFFLVVIYSQLTGWGITNYGLKRALPKLIVTAVMVNLSFLICSIAVDASNIVGMGIRQLFQSVEEAVTQTTGMAMTVGMEGIFAALGGAGLAIGAAVIAFQTGAIWMLIPVVFGALVAVVIGLATIAMRQAVVALLVMISPLAMVCCILPNTEGWYQKWKQLLIQMLIFYPMFSLLFGASALAGFAIIHSATDGFQLILGAAVQILPLFFSWSLMRMSGSILETVNSKMRAVMARPQGGVRALADQQRQLSRARHLAGRAYTPSMRLMQFMANRQIAMGEELSEHQQTIKNRGLAYRASKNYRRDGSPSRRGQRTYGEMAQNLDYQRAVLRDKNNMNRGLEALATSNAAAGTLRARREARTNQRLKALDTSMVNASDYLKAEQARGERIEYDNALGFQERMTRMMNAHYDFENGYQRTVDEEGNEVVTPVAGYTLHKDAKEADLARYNAINQIMDGSAVNIHVAAANAAQSYDTQRKVMETKMNKYFDLTVPTRDVDLALSELTRSDNAIQNIDSIVAGLRVLNQRGDLDLMKAQIENVMAGGRVKLGTHASQALGNFLMFEVGDGDPFMRRFGKYINLETAMMYSAGKRTQHSISMDEMVTGEYMQIDPTTGKVVVQKSKMGLPTLMLGTSLDKMERKALDNLESMLKHAYTKDGQLDVKAYLAKRQEVEKAMAPAFIAASLKFPSGSDQIKSMVTFLTGKNGDGQARWEPGGDLANDAEYAENYFRDRTIEYLEGQTPTNILGLRSDYYEPLMWHLSRQFEEHDMAEWSPEKRAQWEALVEEAAEIQTRYGDLPAEEQAERRAADMKDLRKRMSEMRDDMAAEEFRELLDRKGKLAQIYRTRRSGAANNAKDWVRRWLGLDDEVAVNEKLREINNRNVREHNRQAGADPAEEAEPEFGGFDATDRQNFADQIQMMFEDWTYMDGADVDAFYEETREFVQNNLDGVGEYILNQYDRYRTERPHAPAQELLGELQRLLLNRDNY